MYSRVDYYAQSVITEAKTMVTATKDIHTCIEECCQKLELDEIDTSEICILYNNFYKNK